MMPTVLDDNIEQLNKTRELLVPVVTPWLRAYWECSNEVQAVVRDMLDILSSDDAEDDEKEMAAATLFESLFPTNHNGALGADLEDLEVEFKARCPRCAATIEEMDREESSFSERVASLMKATGKTQEDLAQAAGVGQSAISMMLSRNARPQKRTVARIAEALGVSPSELWPEIQEKHSC